jgi:hypothetical protein
MNLSRCRLTYIFLITYNNNNNLYKFVRNICLICIEINTIFIKYKLKNYL